MGLLSAFGTAAGAKGSLAEDDRRFRPLASPAYTARLSMTPSVMARPSEARGCAS